MSTEELEAELNQTRDDLEVLQAKYDELEDERAELRGDMEAEFDAKESKMIEEKGEEIDAINLAAEARVQKVVDERDMMRRALSGDPCGWVEKPDGTFANTETGETAVDKPPILAFAENFNKVEEAGDDKKKLEKFEKKARDAENRRRDTEVKLNEARSEVSNLKTLNRHWIESSATIFTAMNGFDASLSATCDKLGERLAGMDRRTRQAKARKAEVERCTKTVKGLQHSLQQREFEIKRLNKVLLRTEKKLADTTAELKFLQEKLEVEVEKVSAPLRAEVAETYTSLLAEKAAREDDRRELSDLWPDGWLMPTTLFKYRTLDAHEKQKRREQAKTRDFERALREEIRASVADVSKWSVAYDDYGQAYYLHAVTGEAVWEPPDAMSYKPPRGRDELGNVVEVDDDTTAGADPLAATGGGGGGPLGGGPGAEAMAATAKSGEGGEGGEDAEADFMATFKRDDWAERTDQWNQTYFEHTATSETRWELPSEDEVAAALALAGVGGGADDQAQLAFADMDPEVAALHGARIVVKWLRGVGSKRAKRKLDDDYENGDEALDEELAPLSDDEDGPVGEVILDFQSVEELALGPDPDAPWVFDPAAEVEAEKLAKAAKGMSAAAAAEAAALAALTVDGADGGHDSDAESEAKPEAKLTVPELRERVYTSARREEELEKALRRMRRKVEHWSHKLLARKKEDDLEAKEELLPPDTQLDAAAAAAKAAALQAAADEAAASAAAFAAAGGDEDDEDGDDGDGDGEDAAKPAAAAADSTPLGAAVADLRAELEDEATSHQQRVDALWQRRCDDLVVEAALPHGRYERPATRALAAAAVWAGLKDTCLVPPPPQVWSTTGGDVWGTASFFVGDEWEALADPYRDDATFIMEEEIDEPTVARGEDASEEPLPVGARRHADAFDSEASARALKGERREQAAESAQIEYERAMGHAADEASAPYAAANTGGGFGDGRPGTAASSRPRTAASGAAPEDEVPLDEDGVVGSDIMATHYPVPASELSRRPKQAEQLVDPEAGDWPNPDKDAARLEAQRAERAGQVARLKLAGRPDMSDMSATDGGGGGDDDGSTSRLGDGRRQTESSLPATLGGGSSVGGSMGGGGGGSLVTLESAGTLANDRVRPSRKRRRALPDPVAQLVASSRLHASALAPLLAEREAMRTELWAHQRQAEERWAEEIAATAAALKARVGKREASAAQAAAFQAEIKALRVPKPRPKPPGVALDEGDEGGGGVAAPPATEADEAGPHLGPEEMAALVAAVEDGAWDGKGPIAVPDGAGLRDAQRVQLDGAVKTRNAQLKRAKDAVRREASKSLDQYQAKLSKWEEEEKLRTGLYKEKVVALRLHNLAINLSKHAIDAIAKSERWLVEEKAAEVTRGAFMFKAERRFEAARGKQLIEGWRGPEAIAKLSDECHLAVEARERALARPGGARNAVERMELEHESASDVAELRLRIFDLRERLVEEGRRRRFLANEELALAEADLRRLREERAQCTERDHMNDLLRTLDAAVQAARDKAVSSVMAERRAEPDKWPSVGADLEFYADTKDEDQPEPGHEQCAVEVRCLATMWAARNERRSREAEWQRHMAGGGQGADAGTVAPATDALAPADQWLPTAERRRYEEEISELRLKLEGSATHLTAAVALEKNVAGELRVALDLVQADLAAEEARRDLVVHAVTSSAYSAIEVLKRDMATHVEKTDIETDRFSTALADVSREFNTTRERQGAEIAGLTERTASSGAFLAALRYELGLEACKRRLLEEEKTRLIYAWRTESDKLRAELRSERAHSARLELWIAAMRDDVKYYLMEIRARETMMEDVKREDEEEMRRLKHLLWEHDAGVYALGCDVDALFLFFGQRLANLAGSRRHFNEALRANGAPTLAAAMCKCGRSELRRLGAKVLAGMAWDGFVEQRIVGYDVMESWRLWVKRVAPVEERRLALVGKTFEQKSPTPDAFYEESYELETGAPPLGPRAEIIARRQWALRYVRRREAPNRANMRALGLEPGVLDVLLTLAHDRDLGVVRDATMALTAVSWHEQNHERLGGMALTVRTAVKLAKDDDAEVRAQAATMLANLAYGSQANQERIGEAGGIFALLDLCHDGDVDALEAATGALANVVGLHKPNASVLASRNGVDVLVRLIMSDASVSLLDVDQMDEIQANAVEALANVTAHCGDGAIARVHALGLAPLLLLCGSANVQVKRHAALIVGNVAQHDEHRVAVGLRGGVEAMFLLCEDADDMVKANALWALTNLTWHPQNQERVGRFFDRLLPFCGPDNAFPVRANALCVLANALYYNDKNRRRIERAGFADALVALVVGGGAGGAGAPRHADVERPLVEYALRALVSLTFVDRLAEPLSTHMPLLQGLVRHATDEAVQLQRYSTNVLLNLAVHDSAKRPILDAGAVPALVALQGSDVAELRGLAQEVLALLADVRAQSELAEKKASFGVGGMLQLAKTAESDSLRKLALAAIAESVWDAPAKQADVLAAGGLDVLLDINKEWETADASVALPCLWCLRNLAHDNPVVKDKLGRRGAVELLLAQATAYHRQGSAQLLESALTALVNTALGHDTNCRRILKHGLDALLDMAETAANGGVAVPEAGSDESASGDESTVAAADAEALANAAALAVATLQMVGPYVFIVCHNPQCGARNEGGDVCVECGHPITFTVDDVQTT